MSRFFIIVMAAVLGMSLTVLLVWWFGFHGTEAPRVFLSLRHVEMGTGVTGTFAAPVAFLSPTKGGSHGH
jgi:hypothetical protein